MGFIVPAAIVVILDQLSKQYFWRHYSLGHSFDVFEGFFKITIVRNAGAAFGMFSGGRFFFIAASSLAAVFISYIGWRVPSEQRWRRAIFGVILGGAIGNLIDRLYAGSVIDFLEVGAAGHWWPVFNVADIAVTLGAGALLVAALRGSRGGREAGDRSADGSTAGSLDSPPPTETP